jgi:hypothetical protein
MSGISSPATSAGHPSHALDHTGASFDDGEGNFVYSSGMGGSGGGGYTTFTVHQASATPFAALVRPLPPTPPIHRSKLWITTVQPIQSSHAKGASSGHHSRMHQRDMEAAVAGRPTLATPVS